MAVRDREVQTWTCDLCTCYEVDHFVTPRQPTPKGWLTITVSDGSPRRYEYTVCPSCAADLPCALREEPKK